jgi:hypothetical protein
VKTYVLDANKSHTPEEGAYSPSWPNGRIIIIIIIIIIYGHVSKTQVGNMRHP